jgi:transposase
LVGLDQVRRKRPTAAECPAGQEDWRRIATRYDRTARNFLSAVALAATLSFWAK